MLLYEDPGYVQWIIRNMKNSEGKPLDSSCIVIFLLTDPVHPTSMTIIFRLRMFCWVLYLIKVAVNVSRGEQTFPQIMADFSLFVH